MNTPIYPVERLLTAKDIKVATHCGPEDLTYKGACRLDPPLKLIVQHGLAEKGDYVFWNSLKRGEVVTADCVSDVDGTVHLKEKPGFWSVSMFRLPKSDCISGP